MSEWWTYSLSDFLLFSPRTYYRLFELYNAAIWPLQILALALGAAILGLLLERRDLAGACDRRHARGVLALGRLGLSLAALRHHQLGCQLLRGRIRGRSDADELDRDHSRPARLPLGADAAGAAGRCIFLFALVVFPLIGPLAGRPWTQVEVFGVAPDPTASRRSVFSRRRIGRIGRFWSFP